MAFDFKKEYRALYQPKKQPGIIDAPRAHYLAVRGQGNPNQKGGAYQQAISLLYGVAYTIRMSYKTDHQIPGFFEYVVPPLEGFWWQENGAAMDYEKKDQMHFISLIRLPEFATPPEVDWAKEQAARKKKMDCSSVEFLSYEEGLCVQCMHIGSYDDEPATIRSMHEYAAAQGYAVDITAKRFHHEIYLSDPNKCEVGKLKTILRLPIRKNETGEG